MPEYTLDTGLSTVTVDVKQDGSVFLQVDESPEYMQGNSRMTPAQARQIAEQLLLAADRAESK